MCIDGCVDETKQQRGVYNTEPSAASAGYRLLSHGEIIRSGDEYLDDDAVTWIPVGRDNSVAERWMIGAIYNGFFKPYRRKR